MQSLERILKVKEVAQQVGLARTAIYEREAAGLFPRRVVIARLADGRPKRVGWLQSEVQAWIAARAAERVA